MYYGNASQGVSDQLMYMLDQVLRYRAEQARQQREMQRLAEEQAREHAEAARQQHVLITIETAISRAVLAAGLIGVAADLRQVAPDGRRREASDPTQISTRDDRWLDQFDSPEGRAFAEAIREAVADPTNREAGQRAIETAQELGYRIHEGDPALADAVHRTGVQARAGVTITPIVNHLAAIEGQDGAAFEQLRTKWPHLAPYFDAAHIQTVESGRAAIVAEPTLDASREYWWAAPERVTATDQVIDDLLLDQDRTGEGIAFADAVRAYRDDPTAEHAAHLRAAADRFSLHADSPVMAEYAHLTAQQAERGEAVTPMANLGTAVHLFDPTALNTLEQQHPDASPLFTEARTAGDHLRPTWEHERAGAPAPRYQWAQDRDGRRATDPAPPRYAWADTPNPASGPQPVATRPTIDTSMGI